MLAAVAQQQIGVIEPSAGDAGPQAGGKLRPKFHVAIRVVLVEMPAPELRRRKVQQEFAAQAIELTSGKSGHQHRFHRHVRPVTVTLQGGEKDVLFAVHNWGKVIPADAIGHIFEPAKRLTGTREEAMQGGSLGLGLHIAKLIAEAHGTTIEVASTEGDGTTFTVRWPRSHLGSLSPEPEPVGQADGKIPA